MLNSDLSCPRCEKFGVIDASLRCTHCQAVLEYEDTDGTLRLQQFGFACPGCGFQEAAPDATVCPRCATRLRFFCPLCHTHHRMAALVCSRTGQTLRPEWKDAAGSRWRERAWRGRRQGKWVAGFVAAVLLVLIGYAGISSYNTTRAILAIVPRPVPLNRPQLDVVFVVDSTGSMADEIDVVKERLHEMIAKVRSGQPAPYVRYGLVTYRDRGDEYVTKKWDFTDDPQAIGDAVNSLVADGGGDVPESVNEALHVALHDLSWDQSQKTRRLMFLIGDAGPHKDYANDYNYEDELRSARKMGVNFTAIGCSGIEQCGLEDFRQMASITGGDFQFLTYRQAYRDDTGRTHYTLTEGEKRYVMDEDRKDWRDGGSVTADKYRLKAASAAPPAAMASPAAPLENNLDSVITQKVMQEATKAGVSY